MSFADLPSRKNRGGFEPSFALVVSLAVVFVLLAFLTPLFLGSSGAPADDDATEQRIAPVARFNPPVAGNEPPAVAESAAPTAENAAPAAAESVSAGKDGPAVYASVCTVCHETGLSGAPKKGDKAAWAARIATGKAALYDSALRGKNAMPARGGNPALSDEEVKKAVDFLLEAVR
ncbi:MAG: c-type cytochrome [Zoogloeaceae bacterium]|jgi:cytochrome c5|nr:c-type cytochrome [Zoogloeaceae bacterium]